MPVGEKKQAAKKKVAKPVANPTKQVVKERIVYVQAPAKKKSPRQQVVYVQAPPPQNNGYGLGAVGLAGLAGLAIGEDLGFGYEGSGGKRKPKQNKKK
jgi:hypothetical protein